MFPFIPLKSNEMSYDSFPEKGLNQSDVLSITGLRFFSLTPKAHGAHFNKGCAL